MATKSTPRSTATPTPMSPPSEERTLDTSMVTHVKVVGVLNIITGILTGLAGIAIIFAFTVADVATEDSEKYGTPGWVNDMMASMGWLMGTIALASAVLQLIAGMRLVGQQKSGKMLGILASVLHIVAFWFFPFTTAVGVYGLIILLNRKTDDALVN